MIGLLTILVVSLVIIVAAQSATKNPENKTEITLANPSPAKSRDPTPIFTPTPSDKIQRNGSPPTSTPISEPQSSQSLSDFMYPGSSIIRSTNNTTELESADKPKKITDWYKNKIKSMNMNVTSFVQTNTNDNILNKLVGSDGNREIRIEITKQSNSQIVTISASLIP